MVYCQLEQSQGEAAGEDENINVVELKIFPTETSQSMPNPLSRPLSLTRSLQFTVDDIFEALSHCASLHPDPNAVLDDPEDEAFYDGDFEPFNGDDGEELSEVGRVRSDFVNNSRYQPY